VTSEQHAAWQGSPRGLRLLADCEQGDGGRAWCSALVGTTGRAMRIKRVRDN